MTVADWAAFSTPILTVIGAVGKVIARKVDQVGDHLKIQDKRGAQTERRLIRLETHAGLNPLPPADTYE